MNTANTGHLLVKDEVRELMARYVRYADQKNWKQLAGLFTPDGSFTPLNVAGEALAVMKGRTGIMETIDKSVGSAVAIHHLFSYEIEATGDNTASGIFSMEDRLIRSEEEAVNKRTDKIPAFSQMHGYGHYHGDYVKIEEVWYIAKLVQTRIKLDFTL